MVIEQQIRPVQTDIVQLPVRFQLFPQRRRQMIQHICAKAAVCVGRRHDTAPFRLESSWFSTLSRENVENAGVLHSV